MNAPVRIMVAHNKTTWAGRHGSGPSTPAATQRPAARSEAPPGGPRVALLVAPEASADFRREFAALAQQRGVILLAVNRREEALRVADRRPARWAFIDADASAAEARETAVTLKAAHPDLLAVFLVSAGSAAANREALGADELQAPVLLKDNLHELQRAVKRLYKAPYPLVREADLQTARPRHGERHGYAVDSGPSPLKERLVGKSPAMRELFSAMSKVAVLDCAVLIQGEDGVGKELAARTIHHLNPRVSGPFLGVDCEMFEAPLLARELFGAETDAAWGQPRKGLIEAGAGGALFLDEVDTLSPAIQAQLARVIAERRLVRMGGVNAVDVNTRFMAASTENLAVLSEQGGFNPSLYQALSPFVLEIPPLRERAEDIPLISMYFLHRFAAELDAECGAIDDEAMALLRRYPFPGNVRELESVIESAVIICDEDIIRPRHLPPELHPEGVAPMAGAPLATPRDHPATESSSDVISLEPLMTLAELETAYIRKVMAITGGNRNAAADILGISRSSLWRKLKRMDEEA